MERNDKEKIASSADTTPSPGRSSRCCRSRNPLAGEPAQTTRCCGDGGRIEQNHDDRTSTQNINGCLPDKNSCHKRSDHSSSKLSTTMAASNGMRSTTETAQQQQPRQFPHQLHRMLSMAETEGFDEIVSWQPHGRSFRVHKPSRFEKEVMPIWFKQTQRRSFQRQLNLYGFVRIGSGNDHGGYYHENFTRGNEEQCSCIVRNGDRNGNNNNKKTKGKNIGMVPTAIAQRKGGNISNSNEMAASFHKVEHNNNSNNNHNNNNNNSNNNHNNNNNSNNNHNNHTPTSSKGKRCSSKKQLVPNDDDDDENRCSMQLQSDHVATATSPKSVVLFTNFGIDLMDEAAPTDIINECDLHRLHPFLRELPIKEHLDDDMVILGESTIDCNLGLGSGAPYDDYDWLEPDRLFHYWETRFSDAQQM